MEEKRMISKERGEKVAEENGIKFYETSAKDNVNIEHAFITVNFIWKMLFYFKRTIKWFWIVQLAEDILNKQSPADGETDTGKITVTPGGSTNPKSPGACCKI